MRSSARVMLSDSQQPKGTQRPNLSAVARNSGWLFIDKSLRIGLGFLVGAACARYLGPQLYGTWNYLAAIAVLFSGLASFGFDGLIVRDLLGSVDKHDEIMGSAFVIKVLGGVVAVLLALLATHLLNRNNSDYLLFAAILSSATIFQSFTVIALYFQSRLESKFTVLSQSTAFILSSATKVILILVGAKLIAFIWVSTIEVLLASVFLVLNYRYKRHTCLIWRPRLNAIQKMVKLSWPLIVASLANMIYLRVDQVMLGQMKGEVQVGLYSVAVRLCESWYFIIGIIEASFFPMIIEAKSISEDVYYDTLQKLICLCVSLSLCFILFMNLFAVSIVTVIFGAGYRDAASALRILSWTGVVISFGSIWGQWIIVENMQKWSMYCIGLAAVINVALNAVLIPRYGLNGAAFATAVANVAALVILGAVKKKIAKMNWLLVTSMRQVGALASLIRTKRRNW